MTCIVGLVEDGVVYMGGDSAAVGGLSIETRADSKVFVNGPMIFGFTSSFRMGQLLQYALKVPTHYPDKSDMAYLVTDFVDAIRALYREHGFMGKANEREDGGTFLLGYRGTLYTVHDDFQVSRMLHRYAAVGCGASIALGALHALDMVGTKRTAPNKLRSALAASEAFSAGVRAPFYVTSLPPENPKT